MKTFTNVAEFWRAADRGTRFKCVNRLHPNVTGLRTITRVGSHVLDFEYVDADGKTGAGSIVRPKKAAVSFEGGTTIHWLHDVTGEPAWSWTLLADGEVATLTAEEQAAADLAIQVGRTVRLWQAHTPEQQATLRDAGQTGPAVYGTHYYRHPELPGQSFPTARAAAQAALARRRAEANSISRWAARFAAENPQGADPTDAALTAAFASCVKPPQPDMYPVIRDVYLTDFAPVADERAARIERALRLAMPSGNPVFKLPLFEQLTGDDVDALTGEQRDTIVLCLHHVMRASAPGHDMYDRCVPLLGLFGEKARELDMSQVSRLIEDGEPDKNTAGERAQRIEPVRGKARTASGKALNAAIVALNDAHRGYAMSSASLAHAERISATYGEQLNPGAVERLTAVLAYRRRMASEASDRLHAARLAYEEAVRLDEDPPSTPARDGVDVWADLTGAVRL